MVESYVMDVMRLENQTNITNQEQDVLGAAKRNTKKGGKKKINPYGKFLN